MWGEQTDFSETLNNLWPWLRRPRKWELNDTEQQNEKPQMDAEMVAPKGNGEEVSQRLEGRESIQCCGWKMPQS